MYDVTSEGWADLVRMTAAHLLATDPDLTVRGLAMAVSLDLEGRDMATVGDRDRVLEMVEEWDCE